MVTTPLLPQRPVPAAKVVSSTVRPSHRGDLWEHVRRLAACPTPPESPHGGGPGSEAGLVQWPLPLNIAATTDKTTTQHPQHPSAHDCGPRGTPRDPQDTHAGQPHPTGTSAPCRARAARAFTTSGRNPANVPSGVTATGA